VVGWRTDGGSCVKSGAAARLLSAFLLAFASLSVAHAQPAPCEQAGSDAERQYALPSGLLLAIGRVESGRWDAAFQRTVPWPWAIDAAGEPRLVSTKQEAVNQTRALQAGGLRNIDVGCFQINLQSHPSAFADLEQAFDPVANAQYAARFLSSLHERLGSWEEAVAAYHSSVPERGLPYRQAVYTRWGAPNAVGIPVPDAQPVVVYAIDGMRISVWTPSRIGTAARLITVPQGSPSAAQLPRVITAAR
jgi:soluble lytic murein transglycosylase-like protein